MRKIAAATFLLKKEGKKTKELTIIKKERRQKNNQV
jgi:hypothetical protein